MEQAVSFIAGETVKSSVAVQCIYTKPEVSTVGISESLAKEKGIELKSVKQTLYANARAHPSFYEVITEAVEKIIKI